MKKTKNVPLQTFELIEHFDSGPEGFQSESFSHLFRENVPDLRCFINFWIWFKLNHPK